MSQFNKLPSLVQIWFAEFLAVMFLFPVASKIYERLHPAVEFHSLPLDKADYVFFVLGLLTYAWLLATILRPAVHATRFIPAVRLLAWYVLRLRPAGDEKIQEAVRASWKPVSGFTESCSLSHW